MRSIRKRKKFLIITYIQSRKRFSTENTYFLLGLSQIATINMANICSPLCIIQMCPLVGK